MSVSGRNWCDIVCKNGNKEMDCTSVLKEMINVREGRGSCHVLILMKCYVLSMTYAPINYNMLPFLYKMCELRYYIIIVGHHHHHY